MDVEAFLRMIPKLKSPIVSAQITEQLKYALTLPPLHPVLLSCLLSG
jgi:hypothetical protein